MHLCSEKYFRLQGFFFFIVIDLVKGRAKMALITSSFEKFIQYLTRLSEIKCCESTQYEIPSADACLIYREMPQIRDSDTACCTFSTKCLN